MSNHEYFRQLSSLAAIGQLSADENGQLAEHLLECDSCREVHQDYSYLIQLQLPQADVSGSRRKVAGLGLFPDAAIRDRFFGRARAEGIDFSATAERPRRLEHANPSRKWRIWWWRAAFAAGASAAFIFLGTWTFQEYRLVSRSEMLKISEQQAQASENERLRSQLVTLHHTIELESAQRNELRNENALSEESLRKSEAQLQQAQAQRDKLFAEVQAGDSEKTALESSEQQRDTIIASLRSQNDELDRGRSDTLSELVIQKERNRDLAESLERETQNLEREQQLMAVSNDVRQLMGARNLHIMDVHDVNGESKAAKAFGRVFYAEGQSLIFYAFDLPSGGLSPAKYTFQAWAEKDVSSKLPRSLGTFEVDDHEQRRWVLKVNNPALLAGVESVFVTAEPLRDAKEPRGKKLLYAYIAGQPNHP